MKLYLVAILMLFSCSWMVSGASIGRNKRSTEAMILSLPLNDIDNGVNEHLPEIKQLVDILDEEFENTDSKLVWSDTKRKINEFYNIKVKKCLKLTDPEEITKCKKALLHNSADMVFDIETEIESKKETLIKCDFDVISLFTTLFPELVEYAIVFMRDFSKQNGHDAVQRLWSRTESSLRMDLSEWNKCENTIDTTDFPCYFTQLENIHYDLLDFAAAANTYDDQFIRKLIDAMSKAFDKHSDDFYNFLKELEETENLQ